MADLYALPLFGLAITVIVYAAALQLQKRVTAAHPLLVTTATCRLGFPTTLEMRSR